MTAVNVLKDIEFQAICSSKMYFKREKYLQKSLIGPALYAMNFLGEQKGELEQCVSFKDELEKCCLRITYA